MFEQRENAMKVLVITGAASGIGEAITAQLQHAVDHVIAIDKNEERLESLSASLQIEHTCVCLDVSNAAAIDADLLPVISRFGQVHILVNSAGISDENDPADRKRWDRVIGVNLSGAFYITSCVLPFLAPNGRVINIASVLGKVGGTRNTAYCASKHGLIGFTKALALDLAPQGTTVNAVLPGWVDTPMLRDELQHRADSIGSDLRNVIRQARKRIPLRRLIDSGEVASVVAFLASDQAAGITAQSWVVDGGSLCGA